MGQKSNPIISNINSKNKITKSTFYGKNLEESSFFFLQDLEIRKYLNIIFQTNGIIVSDCRIQRSNNNVNISVDYYTSSIVISKWKYLIKYFKNIIKKSKINKKKSIVNYIFKKKKLNIELFFTIKTIISKSKVIKNKNSLSTNKKQIFYKLKKKLDIKNKKYLAIDKLNTFLMQKKIIRTLFKFTNILKINLKLNNIQNNKFLKHKHKELTLYNKKNFYKETINVLNLIYLNKGSAKLLAELIKIQFQVLKKHNLFLIFIKRVLQSFYKVNNNKIKGIKIAINGRFNGVSRSRGKIIQYGKLPLQTINSDVDYYYNRSHSVYGIFGVKVWVRRA